MKTDNIINGLRKALVKCDAITPENVEAIQSLLNNQVRNDIVKYAEQQVKASKKKHTEEFVVLLGKEYGNVFWTINKDIDSTPYYVLEYTDDEKRAVEVCDIVRNSYNIG